VIDIPDYRIVEKIFESDNTLVYRARLDDDDSPVILKILKEGYPTPEEFIRYKREYEVTRSLYLKGVVKVLGFERYKDTVFIVFEDIGATSLDKLLYREGFTLREFLLIAVKIVESLSELHTHNVIHKDINPSNIIYSSDTGQLQIIDFGISATMLPGGTETERPGGIEGTLAYISPEQTGKMNRAIDHRTDFYALGATFYELLLRRLPFDSRDPMELIHCHMAKKPEHPCKVNESIPKVVSDIVMKLLEKNVEGRYGSASGIKADLQRCLDELDADGNIRDFPIGLSDIPERFQIPQKLYGRDRELRILDKIFERIKKGRSEILLISGEAGIGKTVLVEEMRKTITRFCSYFISGKFDQYKRNMPYSALISAFHELVQQLLTEGTRELKHWRKKFLEALGPNGQIIIDVIPEVELMIGPQPRVPDLPPAATQNRFNLVFHDFIQLFTEPEYPTVLFLDDLQWIDRDSLRLVKLIMVDADTRGLLFIGTYRDNEVNAKHPLMWTLGEIQKAGTAVNHVSLEPLGLENVNELISETLMCDRNISLPLSKLVLAKTNGNPFFVREFLGTLHQKDFIEYNRGQSAWKWSMEQIHAQNITDNVVEMMTGKIKALNEESREVLKLAACLGERFEIETLAMVSEKSRRETVVSLQEPITVGLVSPSREGSKSIGRDVPGVAGERNINYRFSHDRIQQAAYSLVSKEEKEAVHFKVGEFLLKDASVGMIRREIFHIVDRFNASINLIPKQPERDKLARLNLIAGKKAKATGAYEAALRYLESGINLLKPLSESTLNDTAHEFSYWQKQYDLALVLHVEAAEVAYLCAEFDEMEKHIQVVFDQARTLLDKIRVYEIKIQAFYAQNKMPEAVQTALKAMKLLGINFPKDPKKIDVLLAFMKTKLALAGKNIEDLNNLSSVTDPNMQAALRIIVSSVLPAHYAAPQMFPLLVFKAVYLAVKYGAAPVITFAFAGYGLILCGVIGDTDTGYKFGKLAVSLLERLNPKQFKAKTLVAVNSFIMHWRNHLRETLQPFLDAFRYGLEAGDLEFAAIALSCYSRHSYFAGRELPALEQEIETYWNAINRLKQKTALNYQSIIRQVVSNLMGETEKPYHLGGAWYDEEKMIPIHLAANDKAAVFIVSLHKIILSYLFYRFKDAVKTATMSKRYIDGVKGRVQVPLFHFYDSLSHLAMFLEARKAERKRILKRVAANQKKMKKWAYHAPANYLNKFYLVEAERYRVLSEDTKAEVLYDKAIQLAKEHGYTNEEALANELAARFYLERNKEKIAGKYMMDAHYNYLSWGALAKVENLERRYPELLEKKISPKIRDIDEVTDTESRMTVIDSEKKFDLITIMKITRAISSEIVLPKLLDKLIKIIIESSGAGKGVLLLKSRDRLLIEAEGSVGDDSVKLLHSVPVEGAESLPLGIINYVDRTHEYVVLSKPEQDNVFMNDPYILKHKPKSILCGPLIYKSELLGVLYIENSILPDAFSGERSEVIKLLGSQIAVSLENARLYKEMEAQAEEIKNINANLSLEIDQRKKAERELTNYRDHLEELVAQRTKELERSRQALANLEHDIEKRHRFRNIIGKSDKMQEIYALIEDLADLSATVLITGESGTGKELVAEALHYAGKRRDKPFVKVNCSALSETILESELFGHVRGAFTGADRDRKGRFEKVGAGTIFLDEIGDISPYFQKRLLRVLQEREFEPVGSTKTIEMKARVLAATNQNLMQKVRQGEFREDLYYRLRVVAMNLPPLRERREDIPLLLRHFIKRICEELDKEIVDVSEEVLKIFMAYQWPGNIREMKNTLEHICILCKGPTITVEDLPSDFPLSVSREPSLGAGGALTPQAILSALKAADWNRTRAARLLGISRRTFYRKLEEYHLMEEIESH